MVLTWLFTNLPTGLHCWMRRRYSLILASCSAKEEKDTPRLPRPRSAASSSVPGVVTATHIGGWGRLYTVGTSVRRGIDQNSPCNSNLSAVPIVRRHRTYSSQLLLVMSGPALNPGMSAPVA